MQCDWRGVFPAVTTQFDSALEIDEAAIARHLEVLIDSGVTGLVMNGSLGENNALRPEEKRQVVKLAVEVAAGRVPVLSGVSELNTAAACEYVRDVEALGAAGVMVLPAMAYPADPAEAMHHFRTVAGACNLPIILYNNPIAYPVDITPCMFQLLADEPQFVAIKESSGDTRRFTDIFNTCGDRYILFAGVDDLALECTALGARGWIAGVGLAFPKENQTLWEHMTAGRWEEARTLYRWYTPLLHLDVGPKFVQKIKLALEVVGLGSERVRMPRMVLSGAERAETLRVIEAALASRPS